MISRDPRPSVRSRRRPLATLLAVLAAVVPAPAADHPTGAAPSQGFRFASAGDRSLALFEGERPVLVYNHGMIRPASTSTAVPAARARSTYIHPLYGLDGEVLSDDFPDDHPHHRGLFWAWPHVRVGDRHHDLWIVEWIEQRFEWWLAREAGPGGATLGVENGWYAGDRRLVREQLWLRAAPAGRDERALDLDLTWQPLAEPLTLEGAEGKSYGGLTLRFAARADTVITTPLGQGARDLLVTRLPWADLSARFAQRAAASGAAVFVAPDHPDYPPEWMTRHYGALCVGWPGVRPKTFRPGETIRCRYRIWVHRGGADGARVEAAYRAYTAALGKTPAR